MSEGCIVVTGASRGIGAAVVRRLIARGESVLAVARDADALREVCGDSPCARFVVTDLEDVEASVNIVARGVKEHFGIVRGFVHCAGFNRLAPMSLADVVTAQRMYALHVLFPLRFMGWIGKAPNHADGTSCVLVSSLACHEGDVGNVAYAAAKGGVEGMLKSAAAELAPRGVRVNAVAPGRVDTDMTRSARVQSLMSPQKEEALMARYPFGFGTAETVADVIDFFLGTQSAWVTGQCLVADGGKGLT